MKYHQFFLSVIFCTAFFTTIQAQNTSFQNNIPSFFVSDGDTIKTMVLEDMYIYPHQAFKNKQQEKQYQRLIRDVKKTLPYARLIYATLIETYEYLMTLPNEKARQAHLKQMEKDVFVEYKPAINQLTLSQGKLLIRLIDRECNQNSYTILKAFLGSFKANFWNIFAGIFGANLKSNWEPNGKDALAERIIQMIDMGVF